MKSFGVEYTFQLIILYSLLHSTDGLAVFSLGSGVPVFSFFLLKEN